jgi:uncharacterized protein (TIGR03435 family)
VDAGAKLPVYDVVSIKLNKSGSGSSSTHTTPGRFSATNVSVAQLLRRAYDVREDLISGLTGPMASARFDVEAKVVDRDPEALKKLSGRQYGQMLLPFLAERFGLKVHTETKTLPVYELVVGQGGPKFKASSSGSTEGGTNVNGDSKGTVLKATNVSMASLAETLSGQVNRTVIDKTGLAGNFDVGLNWAPDEIDDARTDAGPSIFTALQEQLGLKMQSGKGPVETLVVDHVEMPSEN